MHMVGHQHISVNVAIRFAGSIEQPVEICAIVLVGKKARLPIIAALNQMQRDMRQREPWAPWHGKAMESNDTWSITENGVCPHFLHFLLFPRPSQRRLDNLGRDAEVGVVQPLEHRAGRWNQLPRFRHADHCRRARNR